MLRIRNLRNVYQKRLIRPLYAQTQATPYAAALSSQLVTAKTNSSFGSLSPVPFTYKGGLVPGTVMVAKGELVDVASGATGGAAQVHFGLLANFVGGELDDLGDENYVGVWRGPDSVYEILAPGFSDTGLAAAWTAAATGQPVPLYAGVNGLLACVGDTTNLPGGVTGRQVVAYLIERPNSNRIVVDLKV
jgi:hypothetical protein